MISHLAGDIQKQNVTRNTYHSNH
ncbi:Protein of unknown function [Leuconostoc citreum LBAE C11]|nr:Protein of unknown function [Leuconostoc citreum LBAE C11]